MKNILFAAAVGLCLATFGAAQAADTPEARQTQCNKEAGAKKGDEREAFMKTCLGAKKETPIQAKMKKCSAEAKDRTGEDRAKFLGNCLKKG